MNSEIYYGHFNTESDILTVCLLGLFHGFQFDSPV